MALHQWRTRRDRAAGWAATCFAALGLVVVAAPVVPEHPSGLVEDAAQRLLIVVLLLFPYLLYRFTRTFGGTLPGLDRLLGALTAVMVAWTLLLPHRLPAQGEPRPTWVWAWLVGFLISWSVVTGVVTTRLWRAGRDEPTVARRRMQMLALASATVTLALVLSAASRDPYSGAALACAVIALASGLFFWLGLAPPAFVRYEWRRPEQHRLQKTIQQLMRIATSEEEVVDRVLEPTAAIVGARAVAIRSADGRELGRYERGGRSEDGSIVEVPMPNGSLIVTTSPYAPYFGSEELALVRTLGALTGLALDRGRLFAQERAARLALQRADKLKTDFVALAAHELRTPVTTVYGLVQTLHKIGDRLDPARRDELERTLDGQTQRMASLVEQLLDLSRLDADVITIAPQRIEMRERLRELVRSAAGDRDAEVSVEVAEGVSATADATVLERVVTNLVTNALRYGQLPVVVSAEQRDRHLRVVVEDRGRGVAPEFVPQLFERFARSDRRRADGNGTGLGLAIARSYARAHHGDVLYTDAEPHGARFELVLPVG